MFLNATTRLQAQHVQNPSTPILHILVLLHAFSVAHTPPTRFHPSLPILNCSYPFSPIFIHSYSIPSVFIRFYPSLLAFTCLHPLLFVLTRFTRSQSFPALTNYFHTPTCISEHSHASPSPWTHIQQLLHVSDASTSSICVYRPYYTFATAYTCPTEFQPFPISHTHLDAFSSTINHSRALTTCFQ